MTLPCRNRITAKSICFLLIAFLLSLLAAWPAVAEEARLSAFEKAAAKIPGYMRLSGYPMAPDITFSDGLGTPLTLKDFKGRVIVLNFWATWCPPCRREIPSLIRLQKELAGPDLEIVPISTDRAGLSVVLPYLQRSGFEELDIYLDPKSRLLAAFQSETLPTTIIIDHEGRALGGVFGALEWDSPAVLEALKTLMGTSSPELEPQKASIDSH